MNELQIQFEQGKITTNLDVLKKELTEIASRYDGVVVTEDTVKIAKTDRAELRKVAKAVDDKRKEIKKAWNKPFADFEAEVKATLDIINAPINLIDTQIKEFEERDKSLKEQHCREIYAENIGEYEEFLPFGSVFRDDWLNRSRKDSDIVADISTAKTQIMADMTAIKALQSEFEDEVIKAYKSSGNNLASAIQRNQQLISAKQIAEKKVEQEVKEEPKEEPKNPYGIFTVRPKDEEQTKQLKQFLEFSEIQFSVVY